MMMATPNVALMVTVTVTAIVSATATATFADDAATRALALTSTAMLGS